MKAFQKILDWLYWWMVEFYSPEQEWLPKEAPDIVIASEYCSLKDGTLPKATVLCLETARLCGAKIGIIWGSTEYLGPGASHIDLKKMKIVPDPFFIIASNNTVQEAKRLIEELKRRFPIGTDFPSILVICDQPHLRSLKKIYLHFIHQYGLERVAKINFLTVKTDWNKPHYSWKFQSNRWTWLLANIIRDVLIEIRGIDAMENVSQ